MGNCFKSTYSYREFDSTLMQSLNQSEIENQIKVLTERILNLESKMTLLENNTQNNLKSISDDVHFINNTVAVIFLYPSLSRS